MMSDRDFISWTLAQDGAVPNTGGATGTTGADGAGGGGGGGAPVSPFGGNFMLLIVLMILVMIIFSFMSQRKERKRKEAMLGGIRKHDKVQTIGGVVGSVVEVRNDQVVLKVDESSNTRITFARSAIQQVLNSGRPSSDKPEPELVEAGVG